MANQTTKFKAAEAKQRRIEDPGPGIPSALEPTAPGAGSQAGDPILPSAWTQFLARGSASRRSLKPKRQGRV